MSSSSQTELYQTTTELISENAFYVVLWLGVGLSMTAFAFRSYIRIAYMKRLQASDYLMLLALLMQIALAALGQVYLGDVYLMTHVENGVIAPGADFFDRMTSGLRGDGIMLIVSIVGIWLIKMNFLLFFYNLGHRITTYLVFWWVAVVIVLGCGAAFLGMMPYDCMFGDIVHIVTQCSSEDSVGFIYTKYKVSVVLDCVSDAIIIAFPISILFSTRISLRQRIILSSIFCLVGFTIGVTVVRGSIFGGVYKDLSSMNRKVLDTSWALFWFYIEYMVSFIVSCLVSFRSLWAHKEAKAKARAREESWKQQRMRERTPSDPSNKGSGLRAKLQWMHDTLLDTFNDLDETIWERDVLPDGPPSGRLSIDFATYKPESSAWDDNVSNCNTHIERPRADSDSMASLQAARLPSDRV